MKVSKQHTTKPAGPKKKGGSKKDNKKQQAQPDSTPKGLTKRDLPDATNESTGAMGSGQRQDDN